MTFFFSVITLFIQTFRIYVLLFLIFNHIYLNFYSKKWINDNFFVVKIKVFYLQEKKQKKE